MLHNPFPPFFGGFNPFAGFTPTRSSFIGHGGPFWGPFGIPGSPVVAPIGQFPGGYTPNQDAAYRILSGYFGGALPAPRLPQTAEPAVQTPPFNPDLTMFPRAAGFTKQAAQVTPGPFDASSGSQLVPQVGNPFGRGALSSFIDALRPVSSGFASGDFSNYLRRRFQNQPVNQPVTGTF